MKRFHPSAGALVMMLGILLSAVWMPAFAQDFGCSRREAWMPVGLGLPGRAICAEILNDDLYVLAAANPSFPDRFGLFTWNGTMWIIASEFEVGSGNVTDIQAYGGLLYISGSFRSINGLSGTDGLARWDGTSWAAVPGKPLNAISTEGRTRAYYPLGVYNGELYSVVNSSPPNSMQSMAVWNGTSWRTVPAASDTNARILAFAEWNGALYVGGVFERIGGVDAYGIGRWNGTGWTAAGNEGMEGTGGLFVYQNRLHAFVQDREGSDPYVMWLDADQWRHIPELFPRSEYPAMSFIMPPMAMHNGWIYLGGFNEITDSVSTMRWDGTKAEKVVQLDGWNNFFIDYKGELYTGGNFTSGCESPLPYVARLCTDCGMIFYHIPTDPLGDCDDFDYRYPDVGRILELTPGPQYIMAEEGNGVFRARSGKYSLRLLPTKPHWQQICPEDDKGWDIEIANPPIGTKTGIFVVAPITGQNDLVVSIAGGRVRPGAAGRYSIRTVNVGTVDIGSAMLRFRHDPRLHPDSIRPLPTRTGPGLVEWDLANISPRESRSFDFYCTAFPSVMEGENICAYATVESAEDTFPLDNHDSTCIVVVNSYDPNDLAVFPSVAGNGGLITPRDTILSYTVRFQNTGSDTAYRVVVIDTLSQYLDLVSLRLGASSHPFKLKIGSGGALIFSFDDIDLLHQGASDAGSQGFFKFTVALKEGLPMNTQILNRAHIYFDYNDAITTNTVVSTIGMPAAVSPVTPAAQVRLFPTPAHGMLYLRGAILPGSTVELRDMAGRTIRSVRYQGGGDAEIDLSGISSGTYLVDIETASGRETHRFVVAR